MIKKETVTVDCFYDEDSGEKYFVLPSGFNGTAILVGESPVDLEVRHVTAEQVLEFEAHAASLADGEAL